jgi:uncharacterized small protein (DUF1192 family)
MMAQTVKERPEGEPVSDSSFLSDEKHRLNRIRVCQEEIETLKSQKDKEKSEGLSQGRRKWFNRRIKQLRERIQSLEDR